MNINSLFKPLIMFTGLLLFGALFGIAGGFAGSRLLDGGTGGWEGLVWLLAGIVVGIPLGVIVGLVLIKVLIKYQGSLLFGILGAISGNILLMVLADPLSLNNYQGLLFGLLLVLTPSLGTIDYHLRR